MKQRKERQYSIYSVSVILTIIYELLIYVLGMNITNHVIIMIPLTCAYFLGLIVFASHKKNKKDYLFCIILAIGVLFRTIYILKTDINNRSHDILAIDEAGHLGYIFVLFTTHRLPLTNAWQFYHPPMWHILGALWLNINSLIKMDLNYAIEGLQVLTLLLSSFIIIIGDKIISKLELKDFYRYLILGLLAIHPTLIYFSGSINNDCLLTFLEALTLLLLFEWDDNPNIKNTIKLAIAVGLSVMTKTNGAIMAVPIMFIFIKKFIDIIKTNKKEIKPFIYKIIIFGFISLPIGLWHYLRNIIKFTSSEIPSPGDWLYRGYRTIGERFLSLDTVQLLDYADMSYDYNWPGTLTKSAVFGEFAFDIPRWLFLTLIISFCTIIILFLIGSVKYILKQKKNNYLSVLLITWYISIISSAIFYYQYPYACSMDYRYVAICLVCSTLFIGYMMNNFKHKFLKIFTISTCLLFIVSSIIFISQIN